MSKKVIKSSNKNEKYKLKSVLDTDNIMSGVSLKTVTSIGCASIIASCGNKNNDDNKEKDKNKLKWESLDKDLKEKFNNDEKLFKKFINQCKDFTDNDLTNLIKKLNKEEITDAIKSEENITKDENGNAKIGNKTISINEQKTKNENEKIKGLEYDKLPENIKEKLKKLAEDNEERAKEFWNTIKNEENIDKLINNDTDLKNKYEAFKTEKKNQELINEQLNKAKFDDASQSKITSYISYIDDTLKVKINNGTAKQYLLDQLKDQEINKIVSGIENFYKQIVQNGKITTNTKKQLQETIKKYFENLIGDEQDYKGKIDITVTVADDGSATIKFSSKKEKVQNPQQTEHTINQTFFSIDTDNLKCVEMKDSKENDKELALQRLIDAENNAFYNYTFSEEDKTELNKLVTPKEQTPPNTIKAKIETAITTEIDKISITDKFSNDTTKVSDRLKTFKNIIDDLLKGQITQQGGNKIFIENLQNVDAIYEAMDNGKDKAKGKTAFEGFIKTKFDAKRKEIYDFFTTTTEVSFKKKIKTTLSGFQLLGKKGTIGSNKTFIEAINDKIKGVMNAETYIAKSDEKAAGTNATSAKLEFTPNADKTDINDVTLEIITAFETIKSETKQFLGGSNLDSILGNITSSGTIKYKLIQTLKTELNNLKFSDNGTKSVAKIIQEYMDSDFKDYNNLASFNQANLNGKLQDSNETAISDLKDDTVDNVVNAVLKGVFGDSALCKGFFDALNKLAKVQGFKADDGASNGKKLAEAAGSLANIAANTGTLASAGNAVAAEIAAVVKGLKDNVLAVGTKYNDWVNTGDNDKKPCDEIKSLLKLIVDDYKNNDTFSADAKKWVKLGNLLVKWMYVKSENWDKGSGDKTTYEDDFRKSTVGIASCFFNKVNKYVGKVTGVQAITAGNVDWVTSSRNNKTINIFTTVSNNKGIGGTEIEADLLKTISKNIIWHENLPEDFTADITLYTIKGGNQFTADDIIVNTLANSKTQNLGSMYALLISGGYNGTDFKVYSVESNAPAKGQKLIDEALADPTAA